MERAVVETLENRWLMDGPSNLSVSTYDGVRLNWDCSPEDIGLTAYIEEDTVGDGSWQSIGTTCGSGGQNQGYQVYSTVPTGVHYYYRVWLHTDYSNTAELDTRTAPDPITDLSIVHEENGEYRLYWTNQYEHAFDSTLVEWSTNGGAFVEYGTTISSTGSSGGYLIEGLSANNHYEFRIITTNEVGSSGYSNVASMDVEEAPGDEDYIPGAIGDLYAVQDGSGAYLTWTVAERDYSDTATIQWNADGAGWETYGTTDGCQGSGSGYLIQGISSGSYYQFRIKLSNGIGESDWSNTADLFAE